MSYQLTINANAVLNLSTGCMVHASNPDYVAWLAAPNTPAAADPILPDAQDVQDIAAAKSYSKLAALQAMTPAQVRNWVDSNVTTGAQQTDAIKTLAVAVCVLMKRLP